MSLLFPIYSLSPSSPLYKWLKCTTSGTFSRSYGRISLLKAERGT